MNKFIDPSIPNLAQSKDKDDKKEFECPENGGNGNFADPATCRRFYQVKLAAQFNLKYLSIKLFPTVCRWLSIHESLPIR